MNTLTASVSLPEDLERALGEAVRRIVEVARPQAVILFGSWAEGRAGKDSDVDLLVVTETSKPYLLGGELRLVARDAGLRRALDLLVLTPDEWRYLSDIPGHAAHEAARLGVKLYEAA